jgi:monofunctional biosynthetic peptidoglycan transglycosylase
MKKIRLIVLTGILYFFVYTIQIVVLHRFVNPIVTPLMIVRVVEGAFGGEHALMIRKSWKPIEKISPHMICAVMASEDQVFLNHNGFDWEAIKKAMAYNKKHKGKKMQGASTISQQTAKNVFLFPSRTWIRKGAETYFTFLIELLWSKERIMEVYLNIIELGDGVYGVEAASQKYFKTSASRLTKRQAASLAAILPLPLKWSPTKPGKYISKRIARIESQINVVEKPAWLPASAARVRP